MKYQELNKQYQKMESRKEVKVAKDQSSSNSKSSSRTNPSSKSGGFSTFTLELSVTQKCNLGCEYCRPLRAANF